jgi:hypothetical protein
MRAAAAARDHKKEASMGIPESEVPAASAPGPQYSDRIDRHDWRALGEGRYRREYVNALKPVIISGAFEHWPARTRWSLDYLQDRWGDHEITLKQDKLALREFIAQVQASTPTRPAPYLHNYPLARLPAAARAEIGEMPRCTQPNWLSHPLLRPWGNLTHEELYIGGVGARFPMLHYDGAHTHAFLMQLQGVKEYVAFAPDQTPFMYPRDGALIRNRSAINEVDSPDLERFPAFARARGLRFRLHPGETLFVPSGWWHTVRILTPSITISVNGANAANWKPYVADYPLFYGDGRRWRAGLSAAALSMIGLMLRAGLAR